MAGPGRDETRAYARLRTATPEDARTPQSIVGRIGANREELRDRRGHRNLRPWGAWTAREKRPRPRRRKSRRRAGYKPTLFRGATVDQVADQVCVTRRSRMCDA